MITAHVSTCSRKTLFRFFIQCRYNQSYKLLTLFLCKDICKVIKKSLWIIININSSYHKQAFIGIHTRSKHSYGKHIALDILPTNPPSLSPKCNSFLKCPFDIIISNIKYRNIHGYYYSILSQQIQEE